MTSKPETGKKTASEAKPAKKGPKAAHALRRYIHRDISWLSFNSRVLDESQDAGNPLLERLKFMAIFVSNLDEFFMIRVAGLQNMVNSGFNKKDQYGYYPQRVFRELQILTGELINRLYQLYEGKAVRELEKNDVHIYSYEQLSAEEKKYVRKYFESTLFPVMTPMAVDPGHPFPVIQSNTLAFAAHIHRKGELRLAIIPIPTNMPRLVKLPSLKNDNHFILIEDIVRAFIKDFFNGYTIKDCFVFRLIRDSETSVDEELTPDLLKAIEEEVKQRTWGDIVFLETEAASSPDLLAALCEGLGFDQKGVTAVGKRIDLTFLFELYAKADKPDLMYPTHVPHKIRYENIFEAMAEEDFINHPPYQSFFPAVDLIESAAEDENVLAIKMTLYRTNDDSSIIQALKKAAQNNKQVTVLVEIKARFDEKNNIRWVRELEAAGCHVIYGIPGLKIHSKIALVVRKEEGRIRRYVHLSTGNYNEKTAKVYTDIGYFTANEDIGREVSEIFNVITGYSEASQWSRIVSSPHNLRENFFRLIDREIASQQKYKNGLIRAKINSLEDVRMIDKLYEASQAGVKIELVVRGICCLIPGVKGMSENITVRSIVGRFLEHSRLYIFNNNGNPRVFLASADWMQRNLDRRVELLFEIYKDDIKNHLQHVMDSCWADNVKARAMQPDGGYVQHADQKKKFNMQEYLINYYRKD